MPARAPLHRVVRDRLAEQLVAGLRDLVHPECQIRLVRQRPWASITFSGTRYCFDLDLSERPDEDVFTKAEKTLADHEFNLDGHFVADLLVRPTSPEAGQFCQVEILAIIDPVDQR
ncbi:MAG: hypothetical protein AAGM33_10440 [Pseudomonadota bacterium]